VNTLRDWDAPEAEEEQAGEDGGSDEIIAQVAKTETFWQKLYRRLLPTRQQKSDQLAERLLELDEIVALFPDTPMNYVLRGELYLEAGQAELALVDFRRGLEIASRKVESDSWGLVAQVAQDRAQLGLKRALRSIERQQKRRSITVSSDESED
jgi:tetratricopeptide (TPR) repeat protein